MITLNSDVTPADTIFLHVDMTSFLQIIACLFCSPENKHDGGTEPWNYTNLKGFISTLVHIYHIFTFILKLKRSGHCKTLFSVFELSLCCLRTNIYPLLLRNITSYA